MFSTNNLSFFKALTASSFLPNTNGQTSSRLTGNSSLTFLTLLQSTPLSPGRYSALLVVKSYCFDNKMKSSIFNTRYQEAFTT